MTKLKRKFKNLLSAIPFALLVLALGVFLSACNGNDMGTPQNSPGGDQSSSLISSGSQSDSDKLISKERAKEIAISHAKVSKEEVGFIKAELDRDSGRKYWEIDFYTSDCEYEYDIDAVSEEIIKAEREVKKQTQNSTVTPSSSEESKDYISKTEAEDNALKRANLQRKQVRWLECELDRDGGRVHYEVEFSYERYDYDCKVDAKTGEVYDFAREIDD